MLSLRMDRPFSRNCCDTEVRAIVVGGRRLKMRKTAMSARIDKVTYASDPWPRKRWHPGVTLISLRLPKSLGSTYLYPSPAFEQSTSDGLTVVAAEIVHIGVVC